VLRERVESVVGGAIETGWEHATQEEVVVRENRHLLLVLSEVLDGISRPIVALEAQH